MSIERLKKLIEENKRASGNGEKAKLLAPKGFFGSQDDSNLLLISDSSPEPDSGLYSAIISTGNGIEKMKRGKRRGKYKCSLCGEQKEWHVCAAQTFRNRTVGVQTVKVMKMSDKIPIEKGERIIAVRELVYTT